MSNMKIECIVVGADPELASINLNNTLKKPVNWVLNETSELTNRYSKDEDEWNTIIRTSESVKIPIKTTDNKSDLKPIFKCKIQLISENESGLISVNGTTYLAIANQAAIFEIELEPNIDAIEIASVNDTIQVYEGSTVTYTTNEIDIINEFVKYSITNNLKDDVTIGNTVTQRKLGKTITSFSNDIIISPEENNEILDVLAFSRLNRVLTLVWIEDNEAAGNTLANMPQDSGYIKYYYIGYSSSQKTGIYENVTISYQHDPTNGVY